MEDGELVDSLGNISGPKPHKFLAVTDLQVQLSASVVRLC